MAELPPFAWVPVEVARDSRLTKMQLRVLIALLSFQNKKTGAIFPKRETIAMQCGYSLPAISKTTTQLVELGWLSKVGDGGRGRPASYRVTMPDPKTVSGLITVSGSATVSEEETVAEADLQTVAEPDTKRCPNQTPAKNKPVTNKGTELTLSAYLESRKRESLPVFPEDADGLSRPQRYAEKIGLPDEFSTLAWKRFRAAHTSGERNLKKYVAWDQAFENCLRDNWYQFWWHNGTEFKLTTTGRQAMIEADAKVAA